MIHIEVRHNQTKLSKACGSGPDSYTVEVWTGDCLRREVATVLYLEEATALAQVAAVMEGADNSRH